jgi:uncharacterized membrane protein
MLAAASLANAANFWPLPDAHSSASVTFSYAYSISADGASIVGTCNTATTNQLGEGVHWRKSGATWGVMSLGVPSTPLGALNSPAQSIARDKTVIVGETSFGPPTGPGIDTQAYASQANVFKMLPMLAGDVAELAYGTMQVGSVIVGFGSSTAGYAAARPLVWLGSFNAGWTVHRLNNSGGMANALSNSGHELVGWVRPPSADPTIPAGSARQGVVWARQGGSFHSFWLMSLAGENHQGEALGISTAGDFAVGYSGTLGKKYEPVFWRLAVTGQPTSVHAIPLLAGFSLGRATSVSSLGKRIVGFCTQVLPSGDVTYDAFVWDAAKGTQSLRNILLKAGVKTAASWKSLAATSISDDGKTICGYGTDPQGRDHAWAAMVP